MSDTAASLSRADNPGRVIAFTEGQGVKIGRLQKMDEDPATRARWASG
jgi:hypothetical protein